MLANVKLAGDGHYRIAPMAFAQWAARGFLEGGGVGRPGWRAAAAGIGADFVARRLSPGGSADLLAMSLFLRAMEAA